ncbi:MAG: cytochrome P450 [Verrucomicrobiota bacterium]
MVPFKTWAWQTRHGWLRGLVLELTSAADFLLTGLHAQNPALIRTWDAFGRGNFVFGKALMVVDHAKAEREIAQPQMRGSYFMGLPIVGFSPSTFASNAGPISVSQPARGVLRAHLDEHLLKPHHREPDLGNMRERCAEALGDWVNDSRRDHFLCLRGAVMRVLTLLLADVALEKDEAERITTAYLRRFAELSAFSYYLPAVLSLLGTHEGVRREVYVPLKAKGIDPLAIDMIMFAGMFSVGTILMKCVDHARDFDLDYGALSPRERVTFVIESLRLFPTVSTVHRLLEEPETVKLRGREITMQPGQEIAYPFVCIHRDTTVFADPEALRLDRPENEMAAILSWSKGPHVCPARDLSILVTVMMLDALAESAGDLREVHLRNIEV